jgi:protein-tyrosine phosphatase
MTWFHFPVEDDAAPGEVFEQSWQVHKPKVSALIDQGKCVAIHCRGGSGRTGFMAAVIMRELGMDEVQATSLVKGLRPVSLKLPAHTEYLAKHYDTKS